ncbi:hypothetical protein BWQ96_10485 [Gracilariopsis chorda]|uniref:Uncharacterized protein n=1 Tax=Gracilariopsis chorda TaxID=448386 RepID=A0A2V3ICI9_9FLOR|nr:hypothetical protein BWQ96_10485 [Gracilariopsis chorda]|eukprot:PXF39805.1 hypothetical protein BWQ96_10485 [Gracilariopsis chorda]
MDQSKLFNNCRNRWANVEDYFGFASAALMQAAKSIAASEDKSKEEITQKLELLKQYADRIAKLDVMCKSRARVSKELFNKSKRRTLRTWSDQRDLRARFREHSTNRRPNIDFKSSRTDKHRKDITKGL